MIDLDNFLTYFLLKKILFFNIMFKTYLNGENLILFLDIQIYIEKNVVLLTK